MLETVAEAIGDDLRDRLVFVGGCTTALFITDPITLEDVRLTNDVDLIVDFMPDDERILGFSNRWYAQGIETAVSHPLTGELEIKHLTAPLFIATKLEAYRGRGGDDPLGSHDLEDVVIVVDGREELLAEVQTANIC